MSANNKGIDRGIGKGKETNLPVPEKIPYGGDETQEGTAYIPYFPEGTKLDDSTSMEGAKKGLARDGSNDLKTHADWVPINIKQLIDDEVARREQEHSHSATVSENAGNGLTNDHPYEIAEIDWEDKARDPELKREVAPSGLELLGQGLELANNIMSFLAQNPQIVIKALERHEKIKRKIKKAGSSIAGKAKNIGVKIGVWNKTADYTEGEEATTELDVTEYPIDSQDVIIDKDSRIVRTPEEIQDAFRTWLKATIMMNKYQKEQKDAEAFLRSSKVEGFEEYVLTEQRLQALKSIIGNHYELLEPQYIRTVFETLNITYSPEEVRLIQKELPFDSSYWEKEE